MLQTGGQDGIVSILTHYGLDGPGFNPGGGEISYISVQTGTPEAHIACCTMGLESPAQGHNCQGMAMITHSHLTPRLTFTQRDLNGYSQPSRTTLFSLGIKIFVHGLQKTLLFQEPKKI